MSKSLKLFLGISYIIILFVFLYFIFSFIEVTRLDDFLYYKQLQTNLENKISSNFYINVSIFFLFCVIWVSLLGFGTPILLVSGILFGKWIGTLISVVSISVGALILYLIANFFFKNLVHNLLEKRISNYIHLFKKNEFNYFLIFRLAGGLGIPFGLQNVLPVIFNIKKINYFLASLIGFAPMFFIWNTIGSGLNEYIKQANDFSIINLILNKEIYLPIILFLVLMGISIIIKKKIFDTKN
tara:strand:+ start:2551 stop:3273 length:723 start_codon:yes stop_codon:yes gene_type:complete